METVCSHWTDGSKEFNFWKDFYCALSANYLLQLETCNSRVFPYINIGHHTSSNIDRLEILWRTKASAEGILSFYPKRIIDKKGLHELFPKTSKKLNSWLPRQVQARRRCHGLLWKSGFDTQSPEEQKSAKCSQAACFDEHGSGTDADADLPGEANPVPSEPKQDKAKKKCFRKRQRTSEEAHMAHMEMCGKAVNSKRWVK